MPPWSMIFRGSKGPKPREFTGVCVLQVPILQFRAPSDFRRLRLSFFCFFMPKEPFHVKTREFVLWRAIFSKRVCNFGRLQTPEVEGFYFFVSLKTFSP